MEKIQWGLRGTVILRPHWEVAISVKMWKRGESEYTLFALTQTKCNEVHRRKFLFS